jgi:hypothetical protein
MALYRQGKKDNLTGSLPLLLLLLLLLAILLLGLTATKDVATGDLKSAGRVGRVTVKPKNGLLIVMVLSLPDVVIETP